MSDLSETLEQTWTRAGGREEAGRPLPGLVCVFSGSVPLLYALPLDGGQPISIGRGRVGSLQLEDGCLSRRHAEVSLAGARFAVRDLGSRNGSALDGDPLTTERLVDAGAVLRTGDTVFLLSSDVRPFVAARVTTNDGVAVGPTLRRVWDQIAVAAASGETLHVHGETGAGKELAARHFHQTGPRASGAFVAVNCAAIPAAIAERLLFGARRGAYSGADVDADGYVQAADGGTLFLDEIAELDLQVQAKLLRVLESREVLALGAAKAKKVTFGVVSATHGELRARVDEGKFREDLYFRLGRPQVTLPPLRERREEIPWLLAQALRAAGVGELHASLVETALLRPWPGNVRELFLEAREAIRVSRERGATRVEGEHLPAEAGRARTPSVAAVAATVAPAPAAAPAPDDDAGEEDDASDGDESSASERTRRPPIPPPERDVLVRVLREQEGNISRSARALGVHRTQLRRWMERYGLDAKA